MQIHMWYPAGFTIESREQNQRDSPPRTTEYNEERRDRSRNTSQRLLIRTALTRHHFLHFGLLGRGCATSLPRSHHLLGLLFTYGSEEAVDCVVVIWGEILVATVQCKRLCRHSLVFARGLATRFLR